MKKLILFALTAFIVMMSFNSCGEVDSVYSESWFDKKGEVTFTIDPFDGVILDKFYVSGTKPEDVQNAIPAKRYTHTYLKKPKCDFYIQQWDSKKLEYVTKNHYDFTITSTPQNPLYDTYEKEGVWFYCDEEKEQIYVINALYSKGYNDLKDSAKPSGTSNYRLVIDINGIQNLKIEIKAQTLID